MFNLTEFLNKYLAYCQNQKGLSPKTLKAYRIDLTQFIAFAGAETPTRDTITAYLSDLHERYKPKSIKRKIASIKAFFCYLDYEEILTPSPFARLKISIKEPKTLPRTIPLRLVRRLLTAAYRRSECGSASQCAAALRDVAVFELLFSTGLRVSELCGLTVRDVDLKNRVIRIMGKGSKERVILIGSRAALDALIAYKNKFAVAVKRSGSFFVNRFGNRLSEDSVREMLTRYCKRLHITLHITPHMFRHTFATSLLESDVDIRYIQQLLGHSSITTTQIYTHVTGRKQRHILTAKNPRLKLNLPVFPAAG